MELKDIQSLIKFVTKSGASEVKLEMEDVKITIRTADHNKGETTFIQQMPQMSSSAPAPAAAAPADQAPVETKEESNLITVKSPIIGTFYRKPSPDKPMFVEVGTVIGEGDVLIQKKSMIQELIKIEEQIIVLQFSENIYGDEQTSKFDKYKKLLPSMFTP